MNSTKERKDKCVYLHRLNGKVVYVGSGNLRRVKAERNRSDAHMAAWENLNFQIVKDGLSVSESIDLEQFLIDFYSKVSDLFNKNKQVYKVKSIDPRCFDDYLYYDENSRSGLKRKVPTKNRKIGTDIGNRMKNGYFCVKFIDGKTYYAHRIVYCLVHNLTLSPYDVVDHIDGNKSNNNINNLRATSQSINNRNKAHRPSNTGEYNLHHQPSSKRYQVNWKEDLEAKFLSFSYACKKYGKLERRYDSKELAFQAALDYRNLLVEQGKIGVI